MFYVIGTYSDGLNSILGEYESIGLAQGSIRWQGEPRGEINWHNAEKTRAETWFSGGRWPNEKTQWTICKATDSRGVFAPLDGGDCLTASRGCYTQQAFDAILDRAHA